VARDAARARELYERSCGQEGESGCRRLGDAYAAGDGVPRNPVLAVGYYTKGCSEKDPVACARIGRKRGA
jgi:TPR repeat protein